MPVRQGYWIRNTSALPPSRAVELAVAAERGGWDGVFVSDAVAEDHGDPLALLAGIAVVTTDVTLGTWVVPLPARDVVAVARAAAVVDELSGGRLMLGVGLGNPSEHDALGTDRDAGPLGARFDAHLAVLTELLAGGTVVRQDAFVDLDGVSLNTRCVQQPRPPVLCALQSTSEAPIRRAATVEGLMPYWPGLAEGRDPDVAAGAREAELRDLLAVHRRHAPDGGTVVVPRLDRFGPAYDDLCAELGIAWQLTCDELDEAELLAGPPVRAAS